ncbi:hypothetical protein LEP1GSC125_3777 [Leptospira mayottensis 200901122]|uniref:Uncharacterized protein n=1 Tax=Leptospira mayottensis 200901122 TaxID=1193010 RepID=A0AA87SXH8_9LEPT|nr:hypothetical protein LEP1GSC125_3777 [Leptospira mayottensis 200901122]
MGKPRNSLKPRFLNSCLFYKYNKPKIARILYPRDQLLF